MMTLDVACKHHCAAIAQNKQRVKGVTLITHFHAR